MGECSRRGVLKGIGGSVLAGLAGARAAETEADGPNILLITADDAGLQLGCYGDEQARTPHLDRLASQGEKYENAYVTQASCSPSRSSMFTGLYTHQNGQMGLAHYRNVIQRGHRMHRSYPTIPSVLKQAGYRTGIIGKLHVAPKEAFPWNFRGVGSSGTKDVHRVAREAQKFMTGGEPFFLMVNYFAPHRPYNEKRRQGKGVPRDPYDADDVEPFPFLGVDSPKLRQNVAGYYNCMARLDTGVGMLMERLKQEGLAEDTLVLFVGDHGPPFSRAKTTCYEAGLRVPFIVRWPGHTGEGLDRNELVSTVDMLPTFVEAAGLHPLGHVAGRSMCELFGGTSADWREYLPGEYNSHTPCHFYPRRAIRDDRYKLIVNLMSGQQNPVSGPGIAARVARQKRYDGTRIREVYDRFMNPPRVELYDLEEDPHEFENLAGRPEYAQVEQRLKKALADWRRETDDPYLDAERMEDDRKLSTEACRELKR